MILRRVNTIFSVLVVELDEVLENRRIHLLTKQFLPILILGYRTMLFADCEGLLSLHIWNHLFSAASNFVTEDVNLFLEVWLKHSLSTI